MKPFIYVFSTSLAICALSACSPKPGESGDVAGAGESPAATMTPEEAAEVSQSFHSSGFSAMEASAQ